MLYLFYNPGLLEMYERSGTANRRNSALRFIHNVKVLACGTNKEENISTPERFQNSARCGYADIVSPLPKRNTR